MQNRVLLIVGVAAVAAVLLLSITFIGLPRVGGSRSTESTTAVSGYYFQFELLNQSSAMDAGSTALLMFNISSPVNGTLYFGLTSIPNPPNSQNISIENLTSQDLQLPGGVQAQYPNGNSLTTQGTAMIKVTLSPTVPAGNMSLELWMMQQSSPSFVNGQARSFVLTVLQG